MTWIRDPRREGGGDHTRIHPLVSVVIATQNYGEYLAEAVESVRAQSYPHWELWIIDDGSTDDTRKVVQRWQEDRRIHYVFAERLGQARAKNLGIRLSRGEWVAFLDADDRWEEDKLRQQLALAAEHPEAGVIYCRRRWMDAQGHELMVPQREQGLPSGWILNHLVVQNCVCFSSAMVRREVFSHVGMFDEHLELAIDYDLWLRVGMHYPFFAVSKPLVWYRTGHANLSQRVVERGRIALAILRRAVEQYGLRQKVSEQALREAAASTCRTLAYVLRKNSPLQAARWYGRAWQYGGHWWLTCRGLLACLYQGLEHGFQKAFHSLTSMRQ